MREIKFRFWYSNLQKMSIPYMLEHILLSQHDYDPNKQLPLLLQYTGLKDKNGKEIYEGDILRHTFPYKCNHCDQTHIDAVVEWSHDRWYLDNRTKGNHEIYDTIGMIYDWEEREIIGNIYENPELLTPTNDKTSN